MPFYCFSIFYFCLTVRKRKELNACDTKKHAESQKTEYSAALPAALCGIRGGTPAESGIYPVAYMVKNSPVMQETQVQSLGQEDSLEKGMATHSSILDWRIPWTEEPGRLQSMGLQRVGHD